MKCNDDKFRKHKDIDVWEENYCGVSGVMAAAGAVAIFAHSVSRLQDYITHFILSHLARQDSQRFNVTRAL
jgi:hypothetical protein